MAVILRKLICSFVLILSCSCCMQVYGQECKISFWPRGEYAYLCQGYSMPVWVEIPVEAIGSESDLTLSFETTEGFEVVSYGSSTDFAMQPKPLIVPKEVTSKKIGNKTVSTVKIPSVPEAETRDSLKISKDDKAIHRVSLMVKPADVVLGEYPVKVVLKKDGSQESLASSELKFTVLPTLQNKRPSRMRIEAFDYAGYKNPEFKQAMMDAVLGSGINVLTNMRIYEQDDTIAQLTRDADIRPSLILFWHDIMPELAKKYPDVYPLNKDGERITQPSFKLKNNICHTWCIQNKDKVKDVLKDYFKRTVVGKYVAVTNDNEEGAIARDKSYICGDTYTPITMQAFKEFAAINDSEKLTPEIIAEKYPDKWVDFRCWQSAQMSDIMSDALMELDPSIEYGYYSGHRYVGNLAGFSKNMYATDWEILADKGGIQFGSSGYYGSTKDYAITTKTLGDIPHIPAEMYVENFLDTNRQMPSPEEFSYRLMNSLMYGSGGVAVWYLQVLDAAGYHAISQISSIAAEIEDYIIDGEECSDDLLLPRSINRDSVFAYKLGEKRVIVVINHSAKNKKISIKWKNMIRKPDTVEIVTGRRLADADVMTAELLPKTFAVFITLSQGN